MIPDGEKIIGDYLRAYPALKALNASVVGRTPDSQTHPWVRITQLDAPTVAGSRTEHLIAWLGQFDCYAGAKGGQGEASTLTRIVRAAIAGMPEETLDDAVVTGFRFASCPRIPDNDIEPARERFILTATVYMHP